MYWVHTVPPKTFVCPDMKNVGFFWEIHLSNIHLREREREREIAREREANIDYSWFTMTFFVMQIFPYH